MTTRNLPDKPNMPVVTLGPVLGLATAILGTAAAFGLPITHAQTDELLKLTGAIALALPTLDVWLRSSRLKYLAARHAAEISAAPTKATTTRKR